MKTIKQILSLGLCLALVCSLLPQVSLSAHAESYSGTCGAEGSTAQTYAQEYGFAFGHDYQTVVTEPTVTEGGYTTHTCSHCGDSYVDSYTDPVDDNYTVTFSVLGDVDVIAPMVCNTLTGITLPTADGPEGYSFLGWVEEDCDNVTVLPEPVLTGDYTATGDVTLLALFTYNDYAGNPPTLTKMTLDDTFSDGDKIVIVESGGTHGLYQKAHNYAYVSDYDFTEDAEAILADELKYFNVTQVEGGWYLGDEVNGWLYTPDNQTNLCIRTNTAFMTAFTLTTYEGHLALQHTVSYNDNVFYLNCATNINGALNSKWRMVNANNMSGVSTLNIYKLNEGGPALVRYTTMLHTHTPGEPVVENAADASCTEPGGYDTVVYCTGCGAELSRVHTEVPALGHDVVSHDAKAPTCTEIGWDAYETCSRCDYTTYAEKSALGHDVVNHDAKAPTCTESGWDAYETCARCDYTTYVEKPALGHDVVNHDAKAPTCTESGWDAYETCSRCDYTTYVEKAALGHDYNAVVTEPTCTEKGFTTHSCSRCNDSYIDSETEALGHAWDEGTVTVEPKYQTPGEKTFTCTRCGETRTEEIARLANPFEDVHDEDFFFNPVLWALDETVTGGIDETHFAPERTVMRADAMVFFWAANKRPEFTSTDKTFKDVKKKHWAYDAVMWAVENGITGGTDAAGKYFSPQRTCTRSEILQFLYAAMGKPAYTIENPYSDVKTKHWYYDGAIWAYEKGLEKGENGKFKAKTPCTRGYVVTYLYRYITGNELAE